MIRKTLMATVLLVVLAGLLNLPVSAGNVTVETPKDAAFLYEGRTYLPLRDVADFIGAPLQWDAAKGQAVMSYNGQDLALTRDNINAFFEGQPVELASPPVIVQGKTYVPAETLKKYYGVPMTWDGATSEVGVQGKEGWKTMKVSRRAPWHGGPPPWAPAWGQRQKQEGVDKPQSPGQQGQSEGKGKSYGNANGG